MWEKLNRMGMISVKPSAKIAKRMAPGPGLKAMSRAKMAIY